MQRGGLEYLRMVGVAAVSGAQVSIDAGSPVWRQVSVQEVADEPDEVAAGEVVRWRGEQRARGAGGGLVARRRVEGRGCSRGGLGGAGGHDQQRGECSAGADDDPPGRVHAVVAGPGAEAW